MKFSNIKEKLSKPFNTQLFWLQVCAIGIWLLVIQNYFEREEGAQRVYVVGGNIDADVRGSVDVDNTVSVEVENTVPVEVENTVRTWNW